MVRQAPLILIANLYIVGFVWLMIARETLYYINIRQAYLLSPLYANRMSSRTVLFTSVPSDFLEDKMVRRLFGERMKNFWVATDCEELEKLVKERDKIAMKLEGAEIKLMKLANKEHLKRGGAVGREEENTGVNGDDTNGESGSVASRWVPPNKRPTHRLKFLIGKKVDTINWCRSELQRLEPEIQAEQAKHRAQERKAVGSIFVEYYTQADAQAAYQTTAHHLPLHMAPRYIGINPEDVIWDNLRIKWWERLVRYAATIAFVCALVIFWTVPVAFVGFLSNIDQLRANTSWLKWLYAVPQVIFGVISGLLPSVLLAVLMALLPIVLRLMAKWGGCPSTAAIELRTQNFYFAFQVVQVFLVATVSSAASAAISSIIGNPASAVNLLAEKLPQASNLYISYFIVQGLTIASGSILQLVGLILFVVLGKILDNTPRKIYKRWNSLAGLGWGTVFPVYTLIIVIGKSIIRSGHLHVLNIFIAVVYCSIAPLIFGFATIGMWLIYMANRYLLIYVYNATIDTKGLVYPRALNHLTVGVYIGELCLIGLFGINQAAGPTILMVIFLVFSVLFHVSLLNAVAPLLDTLPKSLEVEEERLLALEKSAASNGNDVDGDTKAEAAGATSLPAPHKQPSVFQKWLRPDRYTDYHTMRRLIHRDFAEISYTPEVENAAYYNPAITSDAPLLWIPRDPLGISRQEIAHTSKAIAITDEGATIDDKGKIHWDTDTRPPIHQEKIYY